MAKRFQIMFKNSMMTDGVYEAVTPRGALDKMSQSHGHESWAAQCKSQGLPETYEVIDDFRIII